MIGKWNFNTLAIYVSVPHVNPEQEISGVKMEKVKIVVSVNARNPVSMLLEVSVSP